MLASHALLTLLLLLLLGLLLVSCNAAFGILSMCSMVFRVVVGWCCGFYMNTAWPSKYYDGSMTSGIRMNMIEERVRKGNTLTQRTDTCAYVIGQLGGRCVSNYFPQ